MEGEIVTLRLFPKHVLIFAVRGKRKIGNLYSPTKGAYSDFHEHQAVWLAEFGPGCVIQGEGAVVGSKGYIIDAFELEDVPHRVWGDYVPLLPQAIVQEILDEAKKTDGFITANVIHEDSIFALEETDRWESLPRPEQQPIKNSLSTRAK